MLIEFGFSSEQISIECDSHLLLRFNELHPLS